MSAATRSSDQYMAYETLSDGLKELLDGLIAVHDNRIQAPSIAKARNDNFTSKVRDDPDEEDEPEMEHPVVFTHPETGKKALYVNVSRTHRFKNMTEESKPLLNYLFEHNISRIHLPIPLGEGSVAFWDNRCLMHRALTIIGSKTL